MRCTLCGTDRLTPIKPGADSRRYLICQVCDLRFLDPGQRLSFDAEQARYELHEYGFEDQGYAKFVAPLIETLTREVKAGASGLDFGAGRVPVLARWLDERGFKAAVYDAFYWPDARTLEARYEFVVSCEVIEHLYEPGREFARLRRLLKPGAPLVVMTEPWLDGGDFYDWYYRRDPTHVSFYSPRTFRWIADTFGFIDVETAGRVTCLRTAGR